MRSGGQEALTRPKFSGRKYTDIDARPGEPELTDSMIQNHYSDEWVTAGLHGWIRFEILARALTE